MRYFFSSSCSASASRSNCANSLRIRILRLIDQIITPVNANTIDTETIRKTASDEDMKRV